MLGQVAAARFSMPPSVVGLWLGVGVLASSLASAQTAKNPSASEKPNGVSASKSSNPASPSNSPPVRGLKPGSEDVVQVLGPDGKPLFIPRRNVGGVPEVLEIPTGEQWADGSAVQR